ncbi:hypothetical protein SmJEL517_g02174 [Synchytrium microbalum]|uniref:Oxidation resistance protein 1 n=1 Tax=Synchytrium microbalum TaxID=1806994 RepID=A0A507C850_9FUNG|nr:uncharacterized protein SmJEL517_g02174 [Synchytrium microbalum]TPX35498.1 hypothetical protein SmJEL517_g02174 [Synchytrium microbalum]
MRKRAATVDSPTSAAPKLLPEINEDTTLARRSNSALDLLASNISTAPIAIPEPRLRLEITSLSRAPSLKKGKPSFVESLPAAKPIEFLDERRGERGRIMTLELANQLRPHLPSLQRESYKWELVYSLMEDGSSLSTLFRCMAEKKNFVIAISDSQNSIFGAFASDPFAPQKGSFGNGTCFLWKAKNHATSVYMATGDNEMYQLSTDNFIAMGLGTDYGFHLDAELDEGVSHECSTYGNEVLAGSSRFQVLNVEVWFPQWF